MTHKHFSDLPLRHGLPNLSAARRYDPYWAMPWPTPSQAIWSSAGDPSRMYQLPARLRLDPDEAARSFWQTTRYWPLKLGLLGAIDQWGTLTSHQAGAILGNARFSDPLQPTVARMFAMGLIDIGGFSFTDAVRSFDTYNGLYRAANTDVFDKNVDRRLMPIERLAVTGLLPWEGPKPNLDRHNVLATELGLRFAEHTDVAMVLGEKYSSFALMATPAWRLRNPKVKSRADLRVIRSDGLQVAIEITSTAGDNFAAKVDKWAAFLTRNPSAETGLVVVFVVAPPNNTRATADRTESRVTAVLRDTARANRHMTGSDHISQRMAFVHWKDWFPGHHLASSDFLSMTVTRFPLRFDEPTDDSPQKVALLDPDEYSFSPLSSWQRQSLVEQSMWMVGTPHWLRDNTAAHHLDVPVPEVFSVDYSVALDHQMDVQTSAGPRDVRQLGVWP